MCNKNHTSYFVKLCVIVEKGNIVFSGINVVTNYSKGLYKRKLYISSKENCVPAK